jgi:hypothetical protein
MAPAGPDDLRQRSIAATHEIATVVREICDLIAAPRTERDERWHARRSALEERKVALVVECEHIAAARARRPPPAVAPRAVPDPARPSDVREVRP